MAESLSPFVYWGQNKDRVYLKVELREITVSKLLKINLYMSENGYMCIRVSS